MPLDTFAVPPPQPETKSSTPVPRCPACGGLLLPLRGFWRCARCQYRLCEECEATPADD
jgi:hypothetical protein